MIEVDNVTKRFGSTCALDGVSLETPRGSVLALLGPNGAGKTTLVRILTTLLRPDGGSASVGGFDVVREAARVRPMIGFAGQSAAVDELLTGRENLELIGLWYHLERSEYKRRPSEVLQRLSLVDAAERLVKTYSGGMRRRLDIGAALIARPGPLPGRADDRPRSAHSQRRVGLRRGARRARYDGPPQHPVHGGGGSARGLDRRAGSGQGPRVRGAGGMRHRDTAGVEHALAAVRPANEEVFATGLPDHADDRAPPVRARGRVTGSGDLDLVTHEFARYRWGHSPTSSSGSVDPARTRFIGSGADPRYGFSAAARALHLDCSTTSPSMRGRVDRVAARVALEVRVVEEVSGAVE